MLDLPIAEPSPPPPRRRLVVAIEGTDGTGKSTLREALAAALASHAIPHLVIRRPALESEARRLLQKAQAHGHPNAMLDLALTHAMDADARQALAHAASLPPGGVAILDRHWPSAAVENYPGLANGLAEQRARHGEPDLWVHCTADWRTVAARLARRGGHDARQTPRAIGGRLAAYEWLMGEMTAPVITAAPDRIILRDNGGTYEHGTRYTETAAYYIAAHIRYMLERP